MIREARLARKMSQAELARRTDVVERTVRNWEQGKHKPHPGQHDQIAAALGFESWDAMTAAKLATPAYSSHHVEGKGIPIINKTPAGHPADYQDVGVDHYSYCPIFAEAVGDPDAFAVEVVGDSMAPEWREGDVIICSPREKCENGDPCFVQFDGSHDDGNTFKRVYDLGDGRLELRPDNSRHKPIIVPREAVIRCCKVVGKWVRY